MYEELGGINSVETIVFHNAEAANDPYVLEKIDQAEAIWFAGGDQWNYVQYWRGNHVAELINAAIAERNIVIGGTSAGMAILGDFYFSAANGSVTSATALANPYDPAVTVDHTPFLQVPHLQNVITDTHYDNPDRRGRHMAFLARMVADHGVEARGIACNEYVAVTIDPDGFARAWGDWPNYQEYAYFLKVNCEEPSAPETCAPGMPLTWDRGGKAVQVYKLPATPYGITWFDLYDWEVGDEGDWQNWTVQAGSFQAASGQPTFCDEDVSGVSTWDLPVPELWWDRERRSAFVQGLPATAELRAFSADARRLPVQVSGNCMEGCTVRFPQEPGGIVILEATWGHGRKVWRSAF